MKKSLSRPPLCVLAAACSAGVCHAAGATVVRDIPYAPAIDDCGLGDLHLPEGWHAGTPVVLQIHGGGWSAGDRRSWSGVAQFFTDEIGFASFNIEYRLASEATHWPACADDCAQAAAFLLSEAFASKHGLKPEKIWICGGSAGGHLALWTGLSLPAVQVAGIVSISGIGDPAPDFAVHADRYDTLFGRSARSDDLMHVDPRALLRNGAVPAILQTHADLDTVVPIASARNFEAAARAAGGDPQFFEYPRDIVPGIAGHRIWIPGSDPHRLIPAIEKRLAEFVLDTRAAPGF